MNMNWAIGASNGGAEITEEMLAAYKENGIEYLEMALLEENNLSKDVRDIKKLADKYGIKIWSCHLPFAPFEKIEPSSTDEKVRTYTVEYFKKLISAVAEIGTDKVVVHASGEPISDEDRPFKMAAAKKSLKELAEFAQTKNVTVAVEDLPRTCLGKNSEEILDLISVHENLKVCFDTNHLLSEMPVDFIKRVGKDIITLHVSDYDFIDERHQLPGEGKVNWQELISALDECGYNGVWMHEVSIEKYITQIRDNAEKLLKNEESV